MGFNIESIGESAVTGLIGGGLGLLLGGMNDRRQIKQQEKLTEMQVGAQKELTEFNREQQLKMWNDTNYGAQMNHLDKAGLNPGLLYGGGGGGGATAQVSAGSAGGGQAQQNPGEIMQSMGMAIQLELLKAQKENIEADTADKLANLPVKGEDATTKGLANKWEAWKQSHNEEGYKIIDGEAYDREGNKVEGQRNITWKESENKMQWDRTLNEINGIVKENAIKDQDLEKVKAEITEIGKKVELLKSQKLNTDEIRNNLEKEGKIKDFEIEMNKVGLTGSSIEKLLLLLIHKL